MRPQRKGWVRVQHRAGKTSMSSSNSSSSSGERTPPPPRPPNRNPPKAPKTQPHHFESSEEEPPPPPPRSPDQAQGQGQPPPKKTQAPPLEDRGRDPYGNVPGVGDTRYVPWKEGGNGGSVSQVTVLGDWDEELDPGEWRVVSQGSNGEGGKKGKKRKPDKEKEGGPFRVRGELLFLTRKGA